MIIYKITNKINNRIYIGQTTIKLSRRWIEHCNHGNYLHNAIRKYGRENFTIEEIDGANSLAELNYLEEHYIYMHNSMAPNGYNLTGGGKSKIVSESTKLKLSIIGKGKKRSEETRRRMSEGQRGRIASQETKDKIINTFKERKINKKIIDNNGVVYESIIEASRVLKIDRASISKVLHKKRKRANKLTFTFLEE